MHGFGPIARDDDEHVFHESWEGRVFAMRRAMGAWGRWNIDTTRHEVELVRATDYLRMSYYERQFPAFTVLLQKHDFITLTELESNSPTPGQPTRVPALSRENAKEL